MPLKINKLKMRLKLLKKLKKVKRGLLNLALLISVSGCSHAVITDNFELWGELICLPMEQTENMKEETVDYFLLHNEKLKQECNDL